MIIFDFDLTLVDTLPVERLRAQRKWRAVMDRVDTLEVYSGIDELLRELYCLGQTLAVVTRSPDMLPRAFIERRRWPIEIVLGFHQVRRRKPDPEALLTAMRMGNAAACGTYHVGDEADDTRASRSANVVAIGAGWGTKDFVALEQSKPDHLFLSVAELHSFLLSAVPAASSVTGSGEKIYEKDMQVRRPRADT